VTDVGTVILPVGHLDTTTREVQSEPNRNVITIKRAAILELPALENQALPMGGNRASLFSSAAVALLNATVIMEGNNFETVPITNAEAIETARLKNRLRHQW